MELNLNQHDQSTLESISVMLNMQGHCPKTMKEFQNLLQAFSNKYANIQVGQHPLDELYSIDVLAKFLADLNKRLQSVHTGWKVQQTRFVESINKSINNF